MTKKSTSLVDKRKALQATEHNTKGRRSSTNATNEEEHKNHAGTRKLGRVFEYIGEDGEQRKMNCVLHCIEPAEIYFNWLYGIKNVSKILSITFVEFSSCDKKSNLLSYEAKDSLIFNVIENRQNYASSIASATMNDSKIANNSNVDGKNANKDASEHRASAKAKELFTFSAIFSALAFSFNRK